MATPIVIPDTAPAKIDAGSIMTKQFNQVVNTMTHGILPDMSALISFVLWGGLILFALNIIWEIIGWESDEEETEREWKEYSSKRSKQDLFRDRYDSSDTYEVGGVSYNKKRK